MATEAGQLVRENLLYRFHKAGWLEESAIKDISDTRELRMLKWTPKGIEQMRKLYAIYDELGLFNVFKGGELEQLHSFARSCINSHGKAS